MEVKSLYIIKRDSGVCMYHHDFGESIFDPHLLSSFITAMSSFFDEAAVAQDSKAKAFEGTGYTLMVESGEWTMGAMAATKDTAGLRSKLIRTLNKFEEQFNLLRWVDMDLAVYARFERVIIEEFVRELVEPRSIIRVRRDWEFYTKNADVIAFLNLIPPVCTVKEAAKFLELPVEIAMNLAVQAVWDRAITAASIPRPDDIYQPTLASTTPSLSDVSLETKQALIELDGETPLSIAAERVKTSDLRRFLEEIAILARRHEVEQVSPGQALVVVYTSAIQSILERCAKVLGFQLTRKIFIRSKEKLLDTYGWLGFIELEDYVDLEVRSSLTAALTKGSVSPETLKDALSALLDKVASLACGLAGRSSIFKIIDLTRKKIEDLFPNMSIEIEWERLCA
ncbi:MAG: hypothetical protein RTU30_03930 [Candidatus Thorarchaeota archaeon]